MASVCDMAREVGQPLLHVVQLEAQLPTLGQILLDTGLQADAGLHGWLPGQGSATPDSAPWSTFE